MSKLPCDKHGALTRGRLLGFYPASMNAGVRKSAYKRLCLDCMSNLIGAHRSDWVMRNPVGETVLPDGCSSCRREFREPAEIHKFFLTAYIRTDQRVDYEAQYCDDCSAMLENEFGMKVHNV